MSSRNEQPRLKCPFCGLESHNFDALERHVQRIHSVQSSEYQPASEPPNRSSVMDDFELAQLLAFEEAGLPAELALSDRSNGPAGQESHRREGAGENGHTTSSRLSENDSTWVQCECGERVNFLELDAHSDMHAQEHISIDESEGSGKDVELSTLKPTSQPTSIELTSTFNTSISKSLRNYDQIRPSRTPPPPERRRGPSLKEIFLGTPASPKRKSAYSAVSSKIGRTKRLGVS